MRFASAARRLDAPTPDALQFQRPARPSGGVNAEGPGGTQLFCSIIIGHAAEQGISRIALVDHHTGQPGSQGNRHFDIESDLIVIRPGIAAKVI